LSINDTFTLPFSVHALGDELFSCDGHYRFDIPASFESSVTFQRILAVATVGRGLLIGLAVVLFSESPRWGREKKLHLEEQT